VIPHFDSADTERGDRTVAWRIYLAAFYYVITTMTGVGCVS